jgi:GxxExxY protein
LAKSESGALIGLLDEELTHGVIGAFYAVFNRLGHGFLENVYVGALEHELRKRGLHVERQVPVAVHYDGIIVGTYRVDLLVEHRLVLEIKAASPSSSDLKQLVNYLRATDLELGLLLSFGSPPVVKRGIFRNELKHRAVGQPEQALPGELKRAAVSTETT